VFRLPLPSGVTSIGYADDTIIVVEGDTMKAVQYCVDASLPTVKGHIRGMGLPLAVDKSETMVFTCYCGLGEPQICLEDQIVRLGSSLKYLGVVLECKGTMFDAHLRAASEKAQRVMA